MTTTENLLTDEQIDAVCDLHQKEGRRGIPTGLYNLLAARRQAFLRDTLHGLNKVSVGAVILLDDRKIAEPLLPCVTWDKAEYRYPGFYHSAVNVEVTGRTFQNLSGGNQGIRVRVTFVGDGEPDTVAAGYMLV